MIYPVDNAIRPSNNWGQLNSQVITLLSYFVAMLKNYQLQVFLSCFSIDEVYMSDWMFCDRTYMLYFWFLHTL